MENEEKKADHVNEPQAGYSASAKRRITFFKSFEEAAEADYEFYRNLTPEQRLAMHYELMIRVYGPAKEPSNRRLSF